MTNSRSAPFDVGHVLAGKYRLTAIIGRGGMGTVYSAENLDLGRSVAIKLLHSELAANDKQMARFRQEARAAASIGHPGIIDVLDLGHADDGTVFMVMELLRGQSLRDLLDARRTLSAAQIVAIASGCLRPLAAAHDAGIIHRDLKPDNIFLVDGSTEQVKLLDFGVSKLKPNEAMHVTTTGVVLGTPLYMAPEQARGDKDIEATADIYSLGAVMYHMLTGRPPFVGDNYSAVLSQVLFDPVKPPEQLVSNVPGPLSTLLLSMLSKNPIGRPQNTAEALAALADIVVPPTTGAEVDETMTASATGSAAVEPTLSAPALAPTVEASSGRAETGRAPAAAWLSRRQLVVLAAAGGALAIGVGAFVATRGSSAKNTAAAEPRSLAALAAGGDFAELRKRARLALRKHVGSRGERTMFAIVAIEHVGDASLAELITPALAGSPDQQVAAARALVALGATASIPALRSAAETAGGRLRVELLAAAVALGDRDNVDALQRLPARGPHLELVTAWALAHAGVADSAATLQRVLTGSPPGSRRWHDAVDGLLALGRDDARKAVRAELRQPDRGRMLAAARLLMHYDDATGKRALERFAARADLASKQPAERRDAVVANARLGRTEHLARIANMATGDPDTRVRISAMVALATVGRGGENG